MTSSAQALVELHDQATRFLRDDGLRLFQVITTASLRGAVLETLHALETSHHAPGPFVELEVPHAAGDPGWSARSEALRRHYDRLRQGDDDPPWPALPAPPSAGGLAGFAEQLGQVLHATPGARPWVVVLAPVHVKVQPQWSRAIAMLLRGSSLGAVRWVVVDVEQSSLVDAVADEHPRLRSKCMPDASAAAAELEAMMAAPPGPGPPGARAADVVPPPRPGAVAPPPDPELPARRELARRLVGAQQALRSSDGAAAVEQQRRARDLCTEAGWEDLAISMELLLGCYLLAANASPQAEASQRRAVERASAGAGRPQLLPIAQLALGSTLMARGDRPAAMLAYSEVVLSAERADAPGLMIEGCRLTGDTALTLGLEAQAIAFWSRAVTVAERDPTTAALGSAGHCARAMAMVCTRRGLETPAARYWETARRLDHVDFGARLRDTIPTPLAIEPVPPAVERPSVDEGPSLAVVPEPSASSGPGPASEAELVPFASSSPTLPLDHASPPAPVAPGEGTADISVDELAALHWPGMPLGAPEVGPLPPPVVVHHWTPDEEHTIRRVTAAVIGDDGTALLTAEELSAIQGRASLPPAREASPEATAILERASALAMIRATDPEADGTAWISPDELVAIRARFPIAGVTAAGPPPPPEPLVPGAEPGAPAVRERIDPIPRPPAEGEQTTVMTPEQARALALRYAQRLRGEGEGEGEGEG